MKKITIMTLTLFVTFGIQSAGKQPFKPSGWKPITQEESAKLRSPRKKNFHLPLPTRSPMSPKVSKKQVVTAGKASARGKQRADSSLSTASGGDSVHAPSPARLAEQQALIAAESVIAESGAAQAGPAAKEETIIEWMKRQPVTDWPVQQARMGLPTNVYIPEVHRERAFRLIQMYNPKSVGELIRRLNEMMYEEEAARAMASAFDAQVAAAADDVLDKDLLRELGL